MKRIDKSRKGALTSRTSMKSTEKAVQKSPDKEYYAEVHNDYYDESDHFWRIDAWKTSDDDEPGKVIAVIHDPSGDVYYIEPEAMFSPLAQEAVKQRIESIKNNL